MDRRHAAYVVAFLALITLAVYGQTLTHDFVNFDDDRYVTDNPHVQHGFTGASIAWAFTTGRESNWHPVTWLSHILDCQIYGLKPWGHHLTALLLHLASTLLLFFLLRRMTGRIWPSAFVAAMFAVHPLHVESVAWVAERKDTLSTLLWMLTVWAYVRYTELPSIKRYLPVMLIFALGLMSKPMLVTLPFTLLLLDYWPLRRTAPDAKQRRGWFHLVLEKLPLLALTAASCTVTYLVQQHGGSVGASTVYTPGVRVANAVVTYMHYLILTAWPHALAVFYLHPGHTLPVAYVCGAWAALAVIFALAYRLRHRAPYLWVGWLWYFITLIPVIGLIQVGSQGMADRYTYVPLIGIFILVAWGIPELLIRRRPEPSRSTRKSKSRQAEKQAAAPRTNILVPALAVIAILASATYAGIQTTYWKNSITLFNHALGVAHDNALAHACLARTYEAMDDKDAAIEQYQAAVNVNPRYAEARNNLAALLVEKGEFEEAIAQYEEALRVQPHRARIRRNLAQAHCNYGFELAQQHRLDESLRHFRETLRLDPTYAEAYNNLAATLFLKGDYAEAWKQLHLSEKYGCTPPAPLVRDLSQKMPDPGP